MVVQTDSKLFLETHRIHVKLPYTAGLLVVLTDSKLETHQIHVKVHFSGGLLVF